MMQPNPPEDPEELARFREEWKEEVRRKKQPAVPLEEPPNPSSDAGPSSHKRTGSKDHSDTIRSISDQTRDLPDSLTHKKRPPEVASKPIDNFLLSPSQQAAIDVYRKAVAAEQKGQLDEAVTLYRIAFRKDPHVDKVYFTLEAQLRAQHIGGTAPSNAPLPPPNAGVESLEEGLRSLAIKDASVSRQVKSLKDHGIVTGSLVSILDTWPIDLHFEKEDEKEPIPVASLPDEILVHMLIFLDVQSLERFSAVNRKARIVTLDSHVWRQIVQDTYQPPQIIDGVDLEQDLLPSYLGDYRRLFVEHPRVRLDGVYIAVCHYIRRGLSEYAWVNVSHLITYHRYLRFYPDGQVLSLLANEEVKPQSVIPIMKPSLRMKGFYIGTWKLVGTMIHITDLVDASGLDNWTANKYNFQMTLELRSRPVGKWNRLDIISYESINTENGEEIPVALKHDRPFWFSKVKSYGGL